MQDTNSNIIPEQKPSAIHFGHLGIITLAVVLLLGAAWLKSPELFDLKKNSALASANTASSDAPHYVPYVAPADDQPQPEVLGASTNQGPEIIGDDGTVQPVDMGQVLGAATEGVQLSLGDVKVNQVPESDATVKNYFSSAQSIENGSVDDSGFEAALSSANQDQINQQAQKFTAVRDALQKLPVPQGLVKLQQLKIIQYNSAIVLLQNFTQSDQNPELVNQNLQQFLTSEQQLDEENIAVAQKYGAEDPDSALYGNATIAPLPTPDASADSGADQ